MALNAKQQRFVLEYIKDLNATAAYIRAGYKSKPGADRACSARLLANANVQAAIQLAQSERSKKLEIDAEWVLKRLRKNYRRAMQEEQVFDRAGNPTGEYVYAGGVANKALELMGKHIGMFVDRHELTGKDGGPVGFADVTTFRIPDNARTGTTTALVGSGNGNGNGSHN